MPFINRSNLSMDTLSNTIFDCIVFTELIAHFMPNLFQIFVYSGSTHLRTHKEI